MTHTNRIRCVWMRFDFFLTRSPSSFSSSWAELEGDGVADLLPGGEGELWVMEFPLTPSWDWLMVDNWLCWLMPDWLLGPSAASIGCWLLVNRESELTICCIWAKATRGKSWLVNEGNYLASAGRWGFGGYVRLSAIRSFLTVTYSSTH